MQLDPSSSVDMVDSGQATYFRSRYKSCQQPTRQRRAKSGFMALQHKYAGDLPLDLLPPSRCTALLQVQPSLHLCTVWLRRCSRQNCILCLRNFPNLYRSPGLAGCIADFASSRSAVFSPSKDRIAKDRIVRQWSRGCCVGVPRLE